jgi:hypothetical protein
MCGGDVTVLAPQPQALPCGLLLVVGAAEYENIGHVDYFFHDGE